MARTNSKQRMTRAALLDTLARVGREHSDATVIFHTTLAHLLDLHPTDYKTMSILERVGAMSAGEIAKQTGLASASVTNLVDRLERKGFVRRVHDPKDRRRVRVEPVVERVVEARRLFASTSQSLARLFTRYADEDLAIIVDFLSRNAARLRDETTKLEADQGVE